MVEAAPWWAVLLAPAALPALALLAATGDALPAAGEAGQPAGAAVGRPLREAVRLPAAQPRRRSAADVPLWRLGVVTVPVSAVPAVLVVPFGRYTGADLSVGVVWFNVGGGRTRRSPWSAGTGSSPRGWRRKNFSAAARARSP